jgi:mannose-6-phosphate isomerase-like protein (cupin superfamily)
MENRVRGATCVFALGLCTLAGVSVVRGQTAAVHVDPAKATYKELVPGVSAAVVWGDLEKGPYAAFIKFAPGHRDALHTHTNTSRLVVLKGAYVHKPEKGGEVRVGAGQYLLISGGDRHVTESDAKEGALFYLESDGGFDLKPVK